MGGGVGGGVVSTAQILQQQAYGSAGMWMLSVCVLQRCLFQRGISLPFAGAATHISGAAQVLGEKKKKVMYPYSHSMFQRGGFWISPSLPPNFMIRE